VPEPAPPTAAPRGGDDAARRWLLVAAGAVTLFALLANLFLLLGNP
jgi:hypothetical protein